MDTWLYYDVLHDLHAYCNPISREDVREMEAVLDPTPGSSVLDIACGHGEMLVGLAERHVIRGVGVDASPYAIRRAEAKRLERVPDADLRFVEGRGEDYRPEGDERFDVAMLVGASWIWKGYEGTLGALRDLAAPGGLLVFGEPFWREEPPAPYLEAEGLKRGDFTDLEGLWRAARGGGLGLVWMRAASEGDWDRYEMLQTASLDRFARAHPDHSDLPEIRERVARSKDAYLRWGRACLGFALWVFRVPEGPVAPR